MKANSSHLSAALIELGPFSNLAIQDCHLSSKSGINELINIGQYSRSRVEVVSSTINGFTSLCSRGLWSLNIRDTTIGDCQSEAIFLREFDRCQVVGCSFSSMGGPCFKVEVGRSSNIPSLLINHCKFAGLNKEAVVVDAMTAEIPCLDLQITDCIFEDCDNKVIQATLANCLPLLIAKCSFSRVQEDCVVLDGCKNYRVVSCNFDLVEGVCLSIFGGQGVVEKTDFKKGVTGLRILGEPQSKSREEKSSQNKGLSQIKPLNIGSIPHQKASIEVSKCHFEQLMGNGIEITDTLLIDCNFSENVIRECLNGILVRDFATYNSMGTQTLNSERSYGGNKSSSHNSLGSPIVSSTHIDTRSYKLDKNLIQKNKGSGVKIENALTTLHVAGGEISKNKDQAIGIIGKIERGVIVEKSGLNKVNVSGEIREIKFEEGLADSNKCTLI